jgi:carbonic anhydrase/acetyltransferase-like protein (isoleucine patch superfamily)
MPIILHVDGVYPKFGNCFIAPNIHCRDVIAGNDCSFWFNAVIRGDVNSIRMGNKVNVQEGR